MVLIPTGVAFVMASSVHYAFNDSVFWFALPYIIMRIIGLILYIRVTASSKKQRSAVPTNRPENAGKKYCRCPKSHIET